MKNYPLTIRMKIVSPYQFQSGVTKDSLRTIVHIYLSIGNQIINEPNVNMIGMCIGREDYLLGQIGLMRKLLGLKGMSYDMDENLKY